MSEQMIVALIGVGSALITGVIMQFLTKSLEDRRKKKSAYNELKISFIFPLHVHVLECKTRLETIDNNIHDLTCDNTIHNTGDVIAQSASWYYEHGHYLISTCYIFSCLFAQLYRIKFKLPLRYFDQKNYDIINDFSKRIIEYFRANLGVYYVVIYDIGKQLYNLETDDLLSFNDYCKIIEDKHAYGIYRLISFFIDIGGKSRTNNLNELRAIINDFNIYLTNISH